MLFPSRVLACSWNANSKTFYMIRRSRKIYKLCRIHPFHLFLHRLVTSSFASALEKFLNYTVSPLTFLCPGFSPRDDVAISRSSCMHPEYQSIFINRVTYSCAAESMSSSLISFHQFFEMFGSIFQCISLFFRFWSWY